MRKDSVMRWTVIAFAIGSLQISLVEAAAPLQKIVFVFSGFNKRTSFIFVAKDRHFFEEQGLRRCLQMTAGKVEASIRSFLMPASVAPRENLRRADFKRVQPG